MRLAFNTQKNGLQVKFTNLSSGIQDQTKVSWKWEFGDGKNSNERNPTHTYAEVGFFLVTLTAKIGAYDPVTITSTVNVTNLTKSQLSGTIYELIDYIIPPDALNRLQFSQKQTYIEKWQLFLQPLVNHTVEPVNYNNELHYEALENQLIMELAAYDYLIYYVSVLSLEINESSTSGSGITVEPKVKKIVTGPSEVEYFDSGSSDISVEKAKSLTKYTQKGGILDTLRQNICMLSTRLLITLPICYNNTRQTIIPEIVTNEKNRPFRGPNPTDHLTIN